MRALPADDGRPAGLVLGIPLSAAAAYAGALTLLEAHRRELDKLAKRLLEARELERVDIVGALG